MVDFIEAFKQGQTTAEKAKNNHQEIDSVFEQLNEQLAKATEGKVKLIIKNTITPVDYGLLAFQKEPPKVERYNIICAVNNLRANYSSELARWEKGIEGYPCKITIGNKQHYCEDKTELEETLALMLQDPIVAGTLADVMRLSENQAAE